MDKDFYNRSSASSLGWDPTWFAMATLPQSSGISLFSGQSEADWPPALAPTMTTQGGPPATLSYSSTTGMFACPQHNAKRF
mgnify:CR=1 FL=1